MITNDRPPTVAREAHIALPAAIGGPKYAVAV
jgi:hypothetical protein